MSVFFECYAALLQQRNLSSIILSSTMVVHCWPVPLLDREWSVTSRTPLHTLTAPSTTSGRVARVGHTPPRAVEMWTYFTPLVQEKSKVLLYETRNQYLPSYLAAGNVLTYIPP